MIFRMNQSNLWQDKFCYKKTVNFRNSGFFAITADEGTDKSNKEPMSICVHWVTDDLEIVGDFLGYYFQVIQVIKSLIQLKMG